MRNRSTIAIVALTLAMSVASWWPSTGASAAGQLRHDGAHARRPAGKVAPYLYLGWGRPPSPTRVMRRTGVRDFTLAFMLSDGGCHPKWDGTRPLRGGRDLATIHAIRRAGGDVVVSFGGWSGKKLGERCATAAALAGAYEKVIDAYRLKAIDIDIEHTEIASATVRQRVVDALNLVRADEPRPMEIYVTIGTAPDGPDGPALDLITRAAAAGLVVDGWTIMPFDFGRPIPNMGRVSVRAAEGLKTDLMTAYGETARGAYRSMGISSMNGRTDEADETVEPRDFETMLRYVRAHHLARFTFWSLNRDRPCGGLRSGDACSGIAQRPWAFTRIVGRYRG